MTGYLRPVQQWNPGKQAEWRQRKTFDVAKSNEQLEARLAAMPEHERNGYGY